MEASHDGMKWRTSPYQLEGVPGSIDYASMAAASKYDESFACIIVSRYYTSSVDRLTLEVARK